MGLFDKFWDAIKLSDDYDDDEFLDDEYDDEEDEEDEAPKPKRRFFQKFRDRAEEDDFDDEDDGEAEETVRPKKAAAATKSAEEPRETRTARTPEPRREKARKEEKKPAARARKAGNSFGAKMNVIHPTSMEDAQDICDTLMDECVVVLNLEGVDQDLAQRIIDFTGGACYALGGAIQMISNFIFILTPQDVDISGDVQSLLNGAFDLPSMRTRY